MRSSFYWRLQLESEKFPFYFRAWARRLNHWKLQGTAHGRGVQDGTEEVPRFEWIMTRDTSFSHGHMVDNISRSCKYMASKRTLSLECVASFGSRGHCRGKLENWLLFNYFLVLGRGVPMLFIAREGNQVLPERNSLLRFIFSRIRIQCYS